MIRKEVTSTKTIKFTEEFMNVFNDTIPNMLGSKIPVCIISENRTTKFKLLGIVLFIKNEHLETVR